MRIRLKTRRDLWLFVAAVTFISVAAAELTLLMLYLGIGEAAFSKANAFYMAALVPMVVAVPVCYLTSSMALQLSKAHAQLKELAHTDELTGLTNRRSFFEGSEPILASARGEDDVAALLVIDADYFKQLNDTYGHAVGDAALQFIAQQIRSCVRQHDLICRLGGEEFAILVAGMDEVGASMLADRILERIASQPMIWEGRVIEMSVSCGIADTDISYEMGALYKAADDALYAAKSNGRNRQVVYTQMPREQALPKQPATH